jgi:DNA-binding CsgD family transcriptional regulator
VKRRLHDLYRRLGIMRRTELLLLVNRLTGAGRTPRPVVGGAPPAGEQWTGNALWLARTLLEEAAVGFAAIDGGRRLLWANREARRLLLSDDGAGSPDPAGASLARTVARVAGTTHSVRLRRGSRILRLVVWRDGPGVLGLRVHEEQVRAAAVEAMLCGRYGLSPRQARAAALVAQGRDHGAVGEALGVRQGTVKSMTSSLYAKLGVHNRIELAALLQSLTGREPSPGGGR